MSRDYIKDPVIRGDFKPKFYWTGNPFEDAQRINRPHIKAEGAKENRIALTQDIITDLSGIETITLNDALNIQNRLLKDNNWRGVVPGFRTNNDIAIKKGDGTLEEIPDFYLVPDLIEKMFPVKKMPKEELLEWYRQTQIIHPFSDLNGRVFGIIVSILNQAK